MGLCASLLHHPFHRRPGSARHRRAERRGRLEASGIAAWDHTIDQSPHEDHQNYEVDQYSTVLGVGYSVSANSQTLSLLAIVEQSSSPFHPTPAEVGTRA